MSYWEESWTKYAIEVARLFKVNREDVFYSLTLTCVPNALNESYKVLVKVGTLPPIESLPTDEKQRIWNMAGSFHLKDKTMRITVSRCLYLLEQLTNAPL